MATIRDRDIRTRMRFAWSYIRWNIAGRPTSRPVVWRVGKLVIRANGKRVIRDWGFDTNYMDTWIDGEALYEYLALAHPASIEWEAARG